MFRINLHYFLQTFCSMHMKHSSAEILLLKGRQFIMILRLYVQCILYMVKELYSFMLRIFHPYDDINECQ